MIPIGPIPSEKKKKCWLACYLQPASIVHSLPLICRFLQHLLVNLPMSWWMWLASLIHYLTWSFFSLICPDFPWFSAMFHDLSMIFHDFCMVFPWFSKFIKFHCSTRCFLERESARARPARQLVDAMRNRTWREARFWPWGLWCCAKQMEPMETMEINGFAQKMYRNVICWGTPIAGCFFIGRIPIQNGWFGSTPICGKPWKTKLINGNSRILKWRYLPYRKAYDSGLNFRGYTRYTLKIWPEKYGTVPPFQDPGIPIELNMINNVLP